MGGARALSPSLSPPPIYLCHCQSQLMVDLVVQFKASACQTKAHLFCNIDPGQCLQGDSCLTINFFPKMVRFPSTPNECFSITFLDFFRYIFVFLLLVFAPIDHSLVSVFRCCICFFCQREHYSLFIHSLTVTVPCASVFSGGIDAEHCRQRPMTRA